MFGLSEEELKKLIAVVSKYFSLDYVCLYGSRARGDYRQFSDVDLCVLNIDSKSGKNKLIKLKNELENLEISYHVHVVNYNEIDNVMLRLDIQHQGIPLSKI
jgi:uncharacterized protein